jgi:hypothetical protein
MVQGRWVPLVRGRVLVGQKQGCGVGEWQRQRRVRTKCEILALQTFFPALALVSDPLKSEISCRSPPPSTARASANGRPPSFAPQPSAVRCAPPESCAWRPSPCTTHPAQDHIAAQTRTHRLTCPLPHRQRADAAAQPLSATPHGPPASGISCPAHVHRLSRLSRLSLPGSRPRLPWLSKQSRSRRSPLLPSTPPRIHAIPPISDTTPWCFTSHVFLAAKVQCRRLRQSTVLALTFSDVFLSPMKPRDKVVTAEDIQSSLYFVHVELPEDANLIDPAAFQDPQHPYQHPGLASRPSGPVIQRKAVPNGATLTTTARKPVPNSLAPVTNFEDRQNVNAGQYAHRSELLGPNYSPRRSYESTRSQAEEDSASFSPTFAEYMPSAGTSLTLIRRDPASGAQWNVARIEDPTAVDVSSTGSASKRKLGAPIYVEVHNPGYSKFLHSHDGSSSTACNQSSALPSDRQSSEQTAKVETVFRRRLWMEGSQHTGDFGHRKTNSSETNHGRPRSHGNDRSSADPRLTTPPAFLSRPDQEYGTLRISDRSSSFRGYVFTSPWNGRCEFLTGAGGNSLKVILHSSQPPYRTLLTIRSVVTSCPVSRGDQPQPCPSVSYVSTFQAARQHPRRGSMTLHRKDRLFSIAGVIAVIIPLSLFIRISL